MIPHFLIYVFKGRHAFLDFPGFLDLPGEEGCMKKIKELFKSLSAQLEQ
jgi:hypothetical protein